MKKTKRLKLKCLFAVQVWFYYGVVGSPCVWPYRLEPVPGNDSQIYSDIQSAYTSPSKSPRTKKNAMLVCNRQTISRRYDKILKPLYNVAVWCPLCCPFKTCVSENTWTVTQCINWSSWVALKLSTQCNLQWCLWMSNCQAPSEDRANRLVLHIQGKSFQPITQIKRHKINTDTASTITYSSWAPNSFSNEFIVEILTIKSRSRHHHQPAPWLLALLTAPSKIGWRLQCMFIQVTSQ